MSHYAKLDQILAVYHYLYKLELDGHKRIVSMTFDKACKTVFKEYNIQDWEITYLRERLLFDKFIECGNENNDVEFRITFEGIKHSQDGGYQKQKEKKVFEENINRETLKKFKFDKISFWVSILALVVSIISYFK